MNRSKVFDEIKQRIRPNHFDALEVQGNRYTQCFRAFDFYTEREGEEDDDQPNFTGLAKVKKIVENALNTAGLQYKYLSIDDQEKAWFSVSVTFQD